MYENMAIDSESANKLQYYIPFRFDDNHFTALNEVLESGTQAPGWTKTAYPLKDYAGFYDHVLLMMNRWESENSICSSWKYNGENDYRYVFSAVDGKEISFSIADLYVHLFRTGIGILGYRLAYAPEEINDAATMIRFQSRVKALSRMDGAIRPAGEAAGSRKTMCLGQLFADLLYGIFGEISFFGVHKKGNAPRVASLFSYMLYNLPGQDETTVRRNLKEVSVRMAMGYEEDHTLSEEIVNSCGELASNVFFYVSQNGCALSICPNQLNKDHFSGSKAREKYDFTFLFVLYQHYSLLNYHIRIATDFPSDTCSYMESTDYADRMQDYLTDIDTFLMKSDIATVSHIVYHNLFYQASREAMNINEDIRSLRSGFESLGNIQQSMRAGDQKKRWHDEQNEQEALDLKVNIFAVILAILAFFPEAVNFTGRIIQWVTKGPSGFELTDWISMALFVVIVLVVILLLLSLRKKKADKGT